jgi:hypothetical protein
MVMEWKKLPLYWHQFVFTVRQFQPALQFLVRHRLWEGFWRYGWVAKLLVFAGVVISLKFLSILLNWWRSAPVSDPLAMLSSVGNLLGTFTAEGYRFLFAGGMKYVVLILMEIIIFHVCRRTVAILLKEDSEASLQAFIHAQIRMIKISARSWMMESIFTLLLKIFFGIFSIVAFARPAAILAVHCYFLGFAVLDNYHEQFGMSIKESAKYARNFIGVALAVGLFVQLAFTVPVLGSVLGPFIAAVAVCLAMHQLSDLHLRRERLPKKEEEDIV